MTLLYTIRGLQMDFDSCKTIKYAFILHNFQKDSINTTNTSFMQQGDFSQKILFTTSQQQEITQQKTCSLALQDIDLQNFCNFKKFYGFKKAESCLNIMSYEDVTIISENYINFALTNSLSNYCREKQLSASNHRKRVLLILEELSLCLDFTTLDTLHSDFLNQQFMAQSFNQNPFNQQTLYLSYQYKLKVRNSRGEIKAKSLTRNIKENAKHQRFGVISTELTKRSKESYFHKIPSEQQFYKIFKKQCANKSQILVIKISFEIISRDLFHIVIKGTEFTRSIFAFNTDDSALTQFKIFCRQKSLNSIMYPTKEIVNSNISGTFKAIKSLFDLTSLSFVPFELKVKQQGENFQPSFYPQRSFNSLLHFIIVAWLSIALLIQLSRQKSIHFTPKLKIKYLAVVVLVQLVSLSNADCISSIEQISFICPANRTYTNGAPTDSAPITITSNGTDCQNSDIIYSSEPTVQRYQTLYSLPFFSWTGSSQAGFSSVQWYQNSSSWNNWVFNITQTAKIAKSGGDLYHTCSFTLTFKMAQGCSNSPEINILTAQNTTNVTYLVGSTSFTKKFPNCQVKSIYCNWQDIFYSMTVTPFDQSKSTSFITYDNETRTVSYNTESNEQAGLYYITQTCTLNTLTPQTNSTYFVLNITESCSGSSYNFSIIPSPNLLNMKYRIGETLTAKTQDEFSLSDTTYCNSDHIKYTWTVNPPSQAIFWQHNQRQTRVYTNDTSDLGNYTVTITGTITTQSSPPEHTASLQFPVRIDQCSSGYEIVSLSFYSLPDITSQIGISNQTAWQEWWENSFYCQPSDIVFSFKVIKPANVSNSSFFNLDSDTRAVAWQTNSNEYAGKYNISLIGTVTTPLINSKTDSFFLNLKATCSGSYGPWTIIPSTATNQKYHVKSGATSVTYSVSKFTFSITPSYCTTNDIVYATTITPQTSGQSYQFITTPADRTATWLTHSSSDIGNYTITVTGAINTYSPAIRTASVSYILYVADCRNSFETIRITPSTASQSIFTYFAVQAAGNTTLSFFSDNSSFCGSSNYQYSMSVTPATSGMNTQFITFDSTSMMVAWYTDTNAQINNYTITITGLLQTLTDWTSSTTFTLQVQGSCSGSIESFTVLSSSPSNQIYTIANNAYSYTVPAFTLQDSLYCTPQCITYVLSVQSQVSGQSTSFIQFNQTTRTVSWNSISTSDVGIFTIMVTGKVYLNSIPNPQNSTFFNLTVLMPCSLSSETIELTAPTLTNQIQIVGGSQNSLIIPKFIQNSTWCSQDDIVYAMNITPSIVGTDTSFITFDKQDRNLTWNAVNFSQIGSYDIAIIGTINSQTIWSKNTYFTLTIYMPCQNSTETNSLKASTAPSNQTYSVGDALVSLNIANFTESSEFCSSDDIVYSLYVSSDASGVSTSFITFNPDTRVISWATSNNSQAGTYNIQMQGRINAASIWLEILQFTLTIATSCSASTENIQITTSTVPSPQLYSVGSISKSITIPLFTENSLYCSDQNIKYSMTVTPETSGVSTSFIKFNETNKELTWWTNSNSQVGGYTIVITGSIIAKTIWTSSISFNLTVLGSCAYSNEANSLEVISAPASQIYNVGAAKMQLNIAEFNQSSKYCTQSEIVYSFIVTPETQNLPISFISFNNSTREVSWQTNSNVQAGNYSLIIIGQIFAASIWSKNTSFILTVQGQCDFSVNYTITAPASFGTLTYIQSQPLRRLSIGNFTVNDAFCNEANITYNMAVIPHTPQQDCSFISFNSQANLFTWYTENDLDLGAYAITISGSINGSQYHTSSSMQFALIVSSAECANSKERINITAPTLIANQIYFLTQEAGRVIVQDFTTDSKYCTSQDIVYSMFASSNQTGQSIDFISFNPATRVVSWATSSSNCVGTYTVQIKATLNRFTQSTAFLLQVLGASTNHPPVLSGLATNQPMISLKDLKNDLYNFGPITADADSADAVTLTYTVQPISGNAFFKLDPQTGIFFVSDRNGLLKSSVTSYQINILLKDSNLEIPGTTTYLITFNIDQNTNQSSNQTNQTNKQSEKNNIVSNFNKKQTNVSNQTIDLSVKPPYWKQITVSNQGQVKIVFTEYFVIPQNATVIIDETVLDIKLISQSSDLLKYQNFKWNLTTFNNDYMTFQIQFENPLYISSRGKSQLDLIKVTCLNNQFFVSESTQLAIKIGTVLSKYLPPQLSGNIDANVQMQKVKQTIQNASNGVVIGTFIANLFMAMSMNLLWGMINALQIIGNMPNLNLYIPGNVNDFYTFINTIQSFNFLPTDSILVSLSLASPTDFNSQNDTSRLLAEQLSDEPDLNIFQSMGLMFFVMLFGVILLFLFSMLYAIIKVSNRIARFKLVKTLYETLKRQLFWNSSLRYFLENYFSLSQYSLMLARSGFDWSTNLNRKQALFAIMNLIVCAVAPVVLTIFFQRRIKYFRDKAFLQRFGSVIGDFNQKSKLSSVFIAIFCYRRLLNVLLIVFMKSLPSSQIQLLTLSCVFVVILFGSSNTYRDAIQRRIEFFNEATILICCYHMFLFTDFVYDPVIRYYIGNSLIVFTMLNISINMCIMVVTTLIIIVKKLRQKVRLYRSNQKKKYLRKPAIKMTTTVANKDISNAMDEGLRLYYEIYPKEGKMDAKIKHDKLKMETKQHQGVSEQKLVLEIIEEEGSHLESETSVKYKDKQEESNLQFKSPNNVLSLKSQNQRTLNLQGSLDSKQVQLMIDDVYANHIYGDKDKYSSLRLQQSKIAIRKKMQELQNLNSYSYKSTELLKDMQNNEKTCELKIISSNNLECLTQSQDEEQRRKRLEFIKKDFWEKMKQLRDPNAFKLPSEILKAQKQTNVDNKKLSNEGQQVLQKDNQAQTEEAEQIRKRLELCKIRLQQQKQLLLLEPDICENRGTEIKSVKFQFIEDIRLRQEQNSSLQQLQKLLEQAKALNNEKDNTQISFR